MPCKPAGGKYNPDTENYKELHEKNREKYLGMKRDSEQGIQEISKERTCFIKTMLRSRIISSKAVIYWCDETIKEMQHS